MWPISAAPNCGNRTPLLRVLRPRAQGEKPFDRMVPGAVNGWLTEVEAVAEVRSTEPS